LTKFLSGASSVFERGSVKDETEKEKAELFKKVGQLQMENDFLKKVLGK
jgi:transposase